MKQVKVIVDENQIPVRGGSTGYMVSTKTNTVVREGSITELPLAELVRIYEENFSNAWRLEGDDLAEAVEEEVNCMEKATSIFAINDKVKLLKTTIVRKG